MTFLHVFRWKTRWPPQWRVLRITWLPRYLISSKWCKICSTIFPDCTNRSMMICGNLCSSLTPWRSLQVLSPGRNKRPYGLAVDIWSLGCTVLEMADGKPPWSGLPGVSKDSHILSSLKIVQNLLVLPFWCWYTNNSLHVTSWGQLLNTVCFAVCILFQGYQWGVATYSWAS